MEIIRDVLLFLHLLGMAIIIGGYFAVIRRPRVLPGMLHAAYLQLLTGLGLVAVLEMTDGVVVDHMKIGIKAVLAIAVAVTAFIGVRRSRRAAAAETAPAGVRTGAAAATADAAHTPAAGPDLADPDPSAGLAHATAVLAVIAVLVAVFM